MIGAQAAGILGLTALLLPLAVYAGGEQVLSLTPAVDCTPTSSAGCSMTQAGYRVTLRFDAPARSLSPLPLTLVAIPVPQKAEVRFVMTGMDMGMNRFAFRRTGSEWHARAMIPACSSGRADWIAVVCLSYPQRIVEMRVPFITP
ncbi:hypothetical protein [Acidihalobacter aeolianus]|nr:hypothetical protein [Acidihalobacter aeolianus]